MSAAVCPHLRCRVRSTRTAITTPRIGLIIVVALAICAAASVRVTHDSMSPAVSPASLSIDAAGPGASVFLVRLGTGASGGIVGGVKSVRPRILRITP
jgi:Mn2+/Fe2+ NRAMP family transporter